MHSDVPRKPLLTGRGLTLVGDFCRATGLEATAVDALIADGKVEGVFRLDGELVGVFDDELPSAAHLRAWGLTIRDDYDPELVRTHVEDPGDDLDDDVEGSGSTWTVGWGDDT